MTTYEIIETLLQAKEIEQEVNIVDEMAINEAAQLLSGSFIYPLYGALWQNFLDMDVITKQLKEMYDNDNHYGIVYFIILLADAVGYVLPKQFFDMCTVSPHIQILSSAIISDWIEYNADSEIEEIEV